MSNVLFEIEQDEQLQNRLKVFALPSKGSFGEMCVQLSQGKTREEGIIKKDLLSTLLSSFLEEKRQINLGSCQTTAALEIIKNLPLDWALNDIENLLQTDSLTRTIDNKQLKYLSLPICEQFFCKKDLNFETEALQKACEALGIEKAKCKEKIDEQKKKGNVSAGVILSNLVKEVEAPEDKLLYAKNLFSSFFQNPLLQFYENALASTYFSLATSQTGNMCQSQRLLLHFIIKNFLSIAEKLEKKKLFTLLQDYSNTLHKMRQNPLSSEKNPLTSDERFEPLNQCRYFIRPGKEKDEHVTNFYACLHLQNQDGTYTPIQSDAECTKMVKKLFTEVFYKELSPSSFFHIEQRESGHPFWKKKPFFLQQISSFPVSLE